MEKPKLLESIGVRMIALIVAALVIQGIVVAGVFTISLQRSSERQVKEYREQLMSQERHELRNYVNLAYEVIESYYERSVDIETLKKAKHDELKKVVTAVVNQAQTYYERNKGFMPEEDLLADIKRMVAAARFDGGNYIWINDTHPTMVMHPIKPALDGRDLSDLKDPEGTYLFVEMAEAVKSGGEGMVNYLWSKPGEEEPKPKISYVKLMPELGWIFGSGAWLEDISAEMKKQAISQVGDMRLGEEEYFFINDLKGIIFGHPNPKLHGKSLMQVEDANGKIFMKEMIQKAKENGEGFVEYWWPKPGEEEASPKLSYVKLFEPWGWIVGMGVYVDQVQQVIDKQTREMDETVSDIITQSVLYSLILFVAVIALSVILVRRGLNKPLQELVHYASCVSGGDLDVCVERDIKGEMGVLKTSMEQMVARLKEMIAETEAKGEELKKEMSIAKEAKEQAEAAKEQAEHARKEGLSEAGDKLSGLVESLSSASEELSAQVEQVTRGADMQRQRTTETATSMEEMNATVLEVAKNASQAAEGADEARNNAEEGQRVVQASVDHINAVNELTEELKANMSELGKQAEAIGAVMNVINDIADQTNLLALNAAIEAARAGEAGRGFAVVADEVRKLAEKTMTATKEVGEAITAIQEGAKKNVTSMDQAAEAVAKATQSAGESGRSLQTIVDLVIGTADQVRSIATASEEQSAASEEINRAIDDITRISKETSQGMNQSSEAISELASLASKLKSLVDELKSS